MNEGVISEQFVGQHLIDLLKHTPQRELHYWLKEGKDSNAEIDFVCAFHGKIVPIEVKSGSSESLKLLHQFIGEKKTSTCHSIGYKFTKFTTYSKINPSG